MSKILSWIVNLIPEQYRIPIAIKKVSYTLGKVGAGLIAGKLVASGKINPEDLGQIQVAITALVAGSLEAVHDWAKLKWPEQKWL